MIVNRIPNKYHMSKDKKTIKSCSFFKKHNVSNDIVLLGNHTDMVVYDEHAHDEMLSKTSRYIDLKS